MEFTLQFGKQLAANHSLAFRTLRINYTNEGENNFELVVLHPDSESKYTWKFISEYKRDITELRLDLGNYANLTTVEEDTPEGWNDAARIALSDQRIKRWLEFDGQPRNQLDKLLLEQLEQHGKVSKSTSRYRLRGFGEIHVDAWKMATTLDVTRFSNEEKHEEKKRFNIHLLDEWEPILQKAIAFLTKTKTDEVGYTTLQEYLQDCQKCPVATEVEYDFDCGDDRSYGALSVEAKLPFGVLRWDNLSISSSGGIEGGFGEKLLLDGTELDECELPNFDVPHYYNGMKAIDRWQSTASDSLLADFNEWVSERWSEVEHV